MLRTVGRVSASRRRTAGLAFDAARRCDGVRRAESERPVRPMEPERLSLAEALLQDLAQRRLADLLQLVADALRRLVELEQPAQVDRRADEHQVGVRALLIVCSSSRICPSP